MAARLRCSQACEECKRRKERCDGSLPCLLCTRRGRSDACVFATTTPTSQVTSARPSKRRRLTEADSPCKSQVPIAIKPALRATRNGLRTYTGSSGTLAFLKAVCACIEDTLPGHSIITGCRGPFLVEDLPACETPPEPPALISTQHRQHAFQAFLDSTRGIFDIFDEHELLQREQTWKFSSSNKPDLWDAILLLVVAIGASETYLANEVSCEGHFREAQTIAARFMLEAPTIQLVQAYMLLTLYLCVVGRRNIAFTHLGVALRAAESIGLHRVDTYVSLPLEDQVMWSRAWKCLRILDVSSCAALGRTLATRSMNTSNSSTNSPSATANDALEAQVDSAGMQLCQIAERILVEVYEQENLTAPLAYQISQDLRDWTHHLPDILVASDSTQTTRPDADMPDALCLNSLTGAYYWTIQLLTRPFLLTSVQRKHQPLVQGTVIPETQEDNDSYATFADACINSAFRCLDVTVQLTQYTNLPNRLFLVNNTTLASALVLGLAFFGDYDQHFPLETGLQKALSFLSHMEGSGDHQAKHYAVIVKELLSAARCYVQQRNKKKLEARSAQVEELFGSVHEKHRGSTSRQMGPNRVVPTDIPAAFDVDCSITSSSGKEGHLFGLESSSARAANTFMPTPSDLDEFTWDW